MNYTTQLGNTYDISKYIDRDMPYGDYNELREQGADLCTTYDGRCGMEFDCEDTDMIEVALVLNAEDDQKTLYCYIPSAEVADYEMMIEQQQSSRYTDYQDTLMDQLLEARESGDEETVAEVESAIADLEAKCLRNSRDMPC